MSLSQNMSAVQPVAVPKPFGAFVGGHGVVWHSTEAEAEARAERLRNCGFDVVVALHPAIAATSPTSPAKATGGKA